MDNIIDMNLEEKNKLLEQQITDERARLSSDRMDISFGELINMYKSNELIIRPEYQRLFRWNLEQKTGLIESILLGIPIPPIFVAEDNDGVWELVDGLQRVSTIISFFGELKDQNIISTSDAEGDDFEEDISNLNYWKLGQGSLISELEDFDAQTIQKKYLINIKRAVCRVEILRGESNTAMKYELFKRLNSGGSKLTAQEIRNAVYRGINPKLNIMLEQLAGNESFKKLTSLSASKKKELYDQELVLRFIAFLDNPAKINLNTELYLDKFMEDTVNNSEFDYEFYREMFCNTIDLLDSLNDDHVFRNERNAFVPAYYEGILIGVAKNYKKYEEDKDLLLKKIEELKIDMEFKRYAGSASNSKSRIKNRLKRANEIFSGDRIENV